MWPVLRAPAAAIPGAGAGDNFLFVWDLWWARQSVLAGGWPLWSGMLFVPYGVDLTLHTHTLLPSAIAGVFFSDVIAGTNAIVCAHLFLNFVTSYALAWRLTRHWPAALLAALIVGWSPFVGERLLGHFNFLAVWVFPLTALVTFATLEGSWAGRVLLGLTLAAIAYIDYYYAVYAAVLVGIIFAAHLCRIDWNRGTGIRARRAIRALAVAIAVALLIAVIVWTTGGTVLHLGRATISMRSPANLLAAAWLLALAAAGVFIASRLRLSLLPGALGPRLTQFAPAVAVAIVCALPLFVSGVRMWTHGDYVSQRYLWRSAPKGIDLATMILGNPRGQADVPIRAYAWFGIDALEQTAWIPIAVVWLSAIALLRDRRDGPVRLWGWIALVFFVWAVGPYVVAFGKGWPLPMPAILLRYVPIVANARIPARAIVVVYVAVAMLAAIGLATLRERQRTGLALFLAVLTLADLLPSRPPLFPVDHPAIYRALAAQRGAGAVCELPMGLRDGFGETGRLDMRVLHYQAIHGRPITGGFVARLPAGVLRSYSDDPLLGVLLRLSAGGPLDAEHTLPAARAAEIMRAHGIRFVMLNRETAPPDLTRYVESALPLRRVQDEGVRTLYELREATTASAAESPVR